MRLENLRVVLDPREGKGQGPKPQHNFMPLASNCASSPTEHMVPTENTLGTLEKPELGQYRLAEYLPAQFRESIENEEAERHDKNINKLNKYKRKLKKYLSKNELLIKELTQAMGDNHKLKLSTSAMQAQITELQLTLAESEGVLKQLTAENRSLTEKNQSLAKEISDRDVKHGHLESMMAEVYEQVEVVTKKLAETRCQNEDLREENTQLAAQNQILHDQLNEASTARQELLHQLNGFPGKPGYGYSRTRPTPDRSCQQCATHLFQIEELNEEIRQRDSEIMIKQGEINILKKRDKKSKKFSSTLEMTVQQLQARLMEGTENCDKSLKALFNGNGSIFARETTLEDE